MLICCTSMFGLTGSVGFAEKLWLLFLYDRIQGIKTIAMTILLLLFLSGLLLQGLKMVVARAADQLKTYVENDDVNAAEVISMESGHILIFNEERAFENYAFVAPTTEDNSWLQRERYANSIISAGGPSGRLGNEAFMQPVF